MNFQALQLTLTIIDPLATALYKMDKVEKNEPGIKLYFIEDQTIPPGETAIVDLGISLSAKFFNINGKTTLFKSSNFDIIPFNLQSTTLRLTNSIIIVNAIKDTNECLKVHFDNIDYENDFKIKRGTSYLQILSPNRVQPKLTIKQLK